MPTRRQDPSNKRFCQSAFASSAEYDLGILANLLSARCHQLSDAEEIAMLWWLQQVSWREGGLEKFASDFLAASSGRFGTPSMLKFGTQAGRVYSADEVRAVRGELPEEHRFNFPISGDASEELSDYLLSGPSRTARVQPKSYPASAFSAVCVPTLSDFVDGLRTLLLDPKSGSPRKGFWNFAALWTTLCEWRQAEVDSTKGRIVETEVSRQIYEELDFAFDSRGFVLLEGREGIGKTEAVRSWCDRKPGKVLYIRLESNTDETAFYRTISRRVGTSSSLLRKAAEIRARIEDALQRNHIMLVLDEAHFLWPMSERSERSAPRRVDWLRTSLIDFGVPVALISTPQFFDRQCDRFRKHGWNANQIQRRLARTVRLPDALSPDDALAVTRKYFPTVPTNTAKRIAGVSLLSRGYLTSISHLRKRADFLVSRRAGVAETALIDEALNELAAQEGINTQPPKRDPSPQPQPQPQQSARAVTLETSAVRSRSASVSVPDSPLSVCTA